MPSFSSFFYNEETFGGKIPSPTASTPPPPIPEGVTPHVNKRFFSGTFVSGGVALNIPVALTIWPGALKFDSAMFPSEVLVYDPAISKDLSGSETISYPVARLSIRASIQEQQDEGEKHEMIHGASTASIKRNVFFGSDPGIKKHSMLTCGNLKLLCMGPSIKRMNQLDLWMVETMWSSQ